MLVANQNFLDMLNSPLRSLRGRVEIFDGSTLASVCGCHDNLESFTIERIGEQGKFFGFGIGQKLTVSLLDRNRELNITTANTLEVEFGVDTDYIYPCPNFYVTEVKRDETTNKLTITAYDALEAAAGHVFYDLYLTPPYTIRQVANSCAAVLGLPLNEELNERFDIYYPTGANFDGLENLRSVLNAIAEATQTVYYIDSDWRLTFKELDKNGEPVAVIDKSKYVNLECKPAYRISDITHTTELGDNVRAGSMVQYENGVEQFIRNNPFYELREDAWALLEQAFEAVDGLSITPFTCDWRGNFLIEPGDKVGLVTKDDNTIVSYILDDSLSFNGGFSSKTQWEYVENSSETETNPSTLGQALNQTFARVDKANKQIELLVSESAENNQAITSLQMNLEGITTSVTKIEEDLTALSTSIEETAEQIKISVKQETLDEINEEGVKKVTTETGFTFNEEGLTVSKDSSNITTTITEDGMIVKRSNDPVLTADNSGVKAMNLHATTYLFVGVNSRFQDYDNNTRTGCFWVGK